MSSKILGRALIYATALLSPVALASIFILGGAALSSGNGFLPAGHFIDAKQAMIDVFPRPDSETASYAREHQAYIGEEYDIAIGVSFGSYPYVCTMVSGPPGMMIEQSTYTTFQNSDYCRVSWTPTASWNGEAEVQVEDQQHSIYDVSWAVWTVGQYTTSSFAGTATVSGTNVLTVNTVTSGAVTPGMVFTGADIPSGDYIAYNLTGTGGTGTYQLASAATGSAGPESVTGAYAGGAVFVSATGTGSTCTYAAPCLMSTAFGSTFATVSFPGAIVYAFGGSYSGSASLPYYADNDIFGNTTPLFEPNNTKKPDALIGIPGQTVTLDATGGPTSGNNYLIATGSESADWYMENIQANGYNATAIDHLVGMLSGGSGTYRQTYDQIVWNNSGYGSGASNNMSMFGTSGNSSPRQYLFITDSAENNRQSGAVGNNYAFDDLYSENDGLIQRNVENSPSSNFDAAFYDKSDVENTSTRENYANVSGANYAFAYGQNQYIVSGSDESCYNVGLNIMQASALAGGGYTAGNFWFYRNTLTTGTGNGYFSQNANYNLEGPAQNTPTTTTGSLTGTYYAKITSLGNSGESSATNGIFGGSNEKSITLSSQGAIFGWTDIASAPGGYGIYIGTASGAENIQFYVPAGTTSFTYTGQAGATATPPSSSTAVVTANQIVFDSNIAQGTSAAVVSGATIGNDGLNVTAPSGLVNSNGTLVSGSPYLGTRGYQIQ